MKTFIRIQKFGTEFASTREKVQVRDAGVWDVTVSQGDRTIVARRCCSFSDAEVVANQISKNYPGSVIKARNVV